MAFQLIDNFRKSTGGGRGYNEGMGLSIYGNKTSSVYLTRDAAAHFADSEYVCVSVDTDARRLYIGPSHSGADGARKFRGDSFAGATLIRRALGISGTGSIHVPVTPAGPGIYAQFPPAKS